MMKLKLEARCLWDIVENGAAEWHEDRTALEAICSGVPAEMHPTLANKESAKAAWEAIRTMRIGDDRVRKSTAQALRAEYEQISFRDGESVEDFALRLSNLVQRLAILGDPEPEEKVVRKYLRVARPRFKQLVVSIETLLNIDELTVEEVTGRLKAGSDDDPPAPTKNASGQLLLTKEQWLEQYKQDAGRRGASSSGGRGKAKYRGRGRGRGSGGGGELRAGGNAAQSGDDDNCKYCGKKGHWAKECRKKKRDEAAQAYLAEDDEPTLMYIADATEVRHPSDPNFPSFTPPSSHVSIDAAPTAAGNHVKLVEAKVFAALDGKEDRDPNRWVLDTGATNHMTGVRSAFSDLDTGIVGTVRFGDGSVVKIEGRGTILFTCKNGEHRALANTYFIPRLTANIISIGQLDEAGFKVLVDEGVMRIRDEERRLLAKVPRSPSRLYILDVDIARPVCLAAHAKEDAWLWHARFGHVNFGALRKMGREGLVRGMPQLEHVDQLCDACLAGKHRRTPFPQRALRRSTEVLQLLHGDLCGPITPPTPSGNRYFLLLVDDYSRYMWIALLPSKDGAPTAIKRIQAAAERKTGKLVRALRTDRGGEFLAGDFEKYCAELGMHRELTAPYSPQQNGVVERRNQTVVSTARSMMKAKDLPGVFWGEAVTTAVYLLNRASSKGSGGKTPYQLWTGSEPRVQHLRTFGCIAHMKVTGPNQKKLDDRSRKTIFVGYEPGSAAYRVFDPSTRRVHVSRDVIFDEAAH